MFKQTRELLREREAQKASSGPITLAERASSSAAERNFVAVDLRNRLLLVEQGTIQDVVPFLRLYRVAMLKGPIITCTYAADSVFQPLGTSDSTVLHPGTSVIVARIPNESFGVIIAALPDFFKTYGDYQADELIQACNVGYFGDLTQKALMYYQPPGGGGINAWRGSHLDALPGDWARISRLGTALFVSDFISGFRLNEYCGIWLNYLDSLLRIAGLNYQLWTGGSEEYSLLFWNAFFRYQGYGFSIDSQLGKKIEGSVNEPYLSVPPSYYEHPDARVSNVEHTSILGDVANGMISRFPQHRVQKWEGALGQGGSCWIVNHKVAGGGLFPTSEFQQSVTAQGTFIIQSRSGILLAKYPFISVPIRVSDPDEAYGKPDIHDFNQKFATFLSKSRDISFTGRIPAISFRHILDIRNQLCNWEATAGFYLIPKKFRIIKESDLYKHFRQGLKLAGGSSLFSPAFIYMDPFGDIILQNGQGARIELKGGSIRISAPDGVYIDSGLNVRLFSKDTQVLAERNVEVISGSKIHLQTKGGNRSQPSQEELQNMSPEERQILSLMNRDQVFTLNSTGEHYMSGCLRSEYINTTYQRVGSCVTIDRGGVRSVITLPLVHFTSPWLFNVYAAGLLDSSYTSSTIVSASLRPGDIPGSLDEARIAKQPGDVGEEDLSTVVMAFPNYPANLDITNTVLVRR